MSELDVTNFIDSQPSLETSWRSIILLGRNVASYKFSLAQTLLEYSKKDSFISLEELALPFAKNICNHLKENEKQITSTSSKFLEYCKKYNAGSVSETDLQVQSTKLGFVNVIDAFHNVSGGEVVRFFEDTRDRNKGIILTDNYYKLYENKQKDNLKLEVNSRWRLWETAISLNINPSLLEINADQSSQRLFVINENKKRVDVTSSRDALNGYQKGKCFYCHKPIQILQGFENSCDVDHFFPHLLKDKPGTRNLDQVWNLVLSCRDCNRGPAGKFGKIPDIKYLNHLFKRNNYFIESHHPLRETILNQTGNSLESRKQFLQRVFDTATSYIPTAKKWTPSETFEEIL